MVILCFILHTYIFAVNCTHFSCIYRYLESDFDAYVQRIEKPYVWGGEPELLMASHVIK